jgi:hypothetical protein
MQASPPSSISPQPSSIPDESQQALAYVNGLYFCTILSALAVLERHFAGMLYAKGLESAKRMSFEDLLKRAKKDGILKPEEESDFDEFRHLRNAYAHFREATLVTPAWTRCVRPSPMEKRVSKIVALN